MIPRIMQHEKFEGWEPTTVHNWLKAEYMIDPGPMTDLAMQFYLGEISTTEFVTSVARMFDEATTKEKNNAEFMEILANIRKGMEDRFKIYIPKPNEPPLNDHLPYQGDHSDEDRAD